MNRRYGIAAASSLITTAILVSHSVSARGAQAGAGATTKLSITVDGGYALVVEKNGDLSLVTPAHKAGAHHDEPQLQLVTGSSTSLSVGTPLAIGGYKFGLGTTAATAPHAAASPVPQTADCSPEPTDDNLTWMPDLLDLHPGATAKLADADVDVRATLGGGALTILGGRGCWSMGSGAARSVSSGPDVARYDVTIPGKSLTFGLAPLGTGGTPKTVSISAKGGWIRLKLSWKASTYPKVPRKVGDPLTDFDRFYGLVTLPTGASQLSPTRAGLTAKDLDFNKKLPNLIPKGECPSVVIRLR